MLLLSIPILSHLLFDFIMKVSEPPKTYKYQEYLSQYENCPPDDYAELSMSAFRWIFEEGHEKEDNNFLPVLSISPKRLNSKMFKNDTVKCEGYALSLFDTLLNAKTVFSKRIKRNKRFGNFVGEFVAEIILENTDGVGSEFSTKTNNKGHFNFHEYENTDLSKKIVEIQKL